MPCLDDAVERNRCAFRDEPNGLHVTFEFTEDDFVLGHQNRPEITHAGSGRPRGGRAPACPFVQISHIRGLNPGPKALGYEAPDFRSDHRPMVLAPARQRKEGTPYEIEGFGPDLPLPSAGAPVAQWIEQRFPKPRAHVRFMPGASAAA